MKVNIPVLPVAFGYSGTPAYELVDAEAVFLRVHDLQQADAQPGKVRAAQRTLKHRVLYTLPEGLARFGDLPKSAAALHGFC